MLPKLKSVPKLKSTMSTPALKVKSPVKDYLLSSTSKAYRQDSSVHGANIDAFITQVKDNMNSSSSNHAERDLIKKLEEYK